jgi:hypothetical protein
LIATVGSELFLMDARSLWPSGSVSPLNHWGHLAGKLGASPALERPFLIGLRGVFLWGTETHDTRHTQAYDDAFVLLTSAGAPRVFKGSTHAYQLHSKLSPDVNGDGVGDVGTIDPGRYLLTYGTTDAAGCPTFVLKLPNGSGVIPCTRDTDHDGRPEADRHYTATAILMHSGFDAPPGAEHRSSIGCQTCSADYLRLMLQAGKVIDYALVNATTAIDLMRDFGETSERPST